MADLHFKHVLYEITLMEGKRGELGLNKQVDLAWIVPAGGWFPFTLHPSSKASSRFCSGTVTTQRIIKFVYLLFPAEFHNY